MINKIIEIGNGVVDISKVTATTPIYYDEIEIKVKKNKSSKPMQLGIKPKLRRLYYFSICMGHHWVKITPLKNQFDTYSGGRHFCEQEHRKFIKTFQDWHKKDNE